MKIEEFTIKFNEDLEWDIIGEKPTDKDWLHLEDDMKPILKVVDNGIGYYEYGSMTGNHVEWDTEIQHEGDALKIKALISNSALLNMTPEEIINEFLEYQDYIPNDYVWSTEGCSVECGFTLKCIKAQYSSDQKAVLAEIGYCED